jgi:hypothetical protein
MPNGAEIRRPRQQSLSHYGRKKAARVAKMTILSPPASLAPKKCAILAGQAGGNVANLSEGHDA